MRAFLASDTGKTIMKDTAIEITIDNLSYIGTEKAIFSGKQLIIDPLKSFKMILNALIILKILWSARSIDRRRVRHDLSSLKGARSLVCR